MKRTTVFLEDKLLRDLKRLAARRGVSFATVVREAAAAYVAEPSAAAVPGIAGQFASGERDTSERVDELLWKDPHGVTVVADTGPLYALVDKSDAWHGRVLEWWKHNREPIVVPASVVPEVTYLLQTRIGPRAGVAFVRAVADGQFATEFVELEDMDRAASVMQQYSDFPLGFVDATVIAIAERLDARSILTTDRRHFGAVRPRHARGFILEPQR